MTQLRVHNVFHAHFPMSEYLLNSDVEKAIEPLVLSYWYVITEVHNDDGYVVADSYFISSDYYLFCHKRKIVFDIDGFINYKNIFRNSSK